ncbi:MAG: cytosolic protein [Lutibacter sp.]|nr:MAG: cytosolic protein [Lutibacter sp.]
MGLFSNIFGTSNSEKEIIKSNVNWIPLNSLEQLEEIKELSKTESIVIFKHSTRCAISRSVIKKFENSFDEELSALKVYYLDLLSFRDVSNEVGYQFQVIHQSPQLLVVKNEVTVAFASHYDIMSIDLKTFI